MADKEQIVDNLVDILRGMKDDKSSVERKKVGLIEDVWIKGSKREKKVKAKIDTGASKSSISKDLLLEIGAPPAIGKVLVTSAMSTEQRPIVELLIGLGTGRWVRSTFTVASRENMQYPLLIGKNTIIKLNIIVDPAKQAARDLKEIK